MNTPPPYGITRTTRSHKPHGDAPNDTRDRAATGSEGEILAGDLSGTLATVDGVTTTYLTRKHCPCCDKRAERTTEVIRNGITYGYYLCPRGHSWEMHWREIE